MERTRRGTEPRLVGPIRGELLGVERLAAHARALARRQELLPVDETRDITPILRRLEETHGILRQTRDALNQASERHVDVSPAGDWILDNFYIIEEHIREIRASMPNDYYRALPKLANGTLAGFPRVYEVAIELIAHTEGHINRENVELYAGEFQTAASLTIGELWAVPIMLRLGLMENIRRMALRVGQRLEQVESADRHAAQLRDASKEGAGALGDALALFVQGHPPFTPAFVTRFLQQIRGYDASFTPLVWLEEWIAEDGLPAAEAVARSNQHAALTQVMVANSITSLRNIALLDWRRFFESQSRTEHILRLDPTGDYARMTFATRDRYRHTVERLARRSQLSEQEVARHALGLAEKAIREAAPERHRHIGYWLVDDGRIRLEREIRYHPYMHERVHRALQRHPDTVYFGAMIVATLALLVSVVGFTDPETLGGTLAVLVFALVPANQMAVLLVNQLVTLVLPPRLMPRLEFRETGIAREFRTVVAVPTLFSDVAAVNGMLEHIEVQFLANRDRELHFAILSDFTDAPAEHMPEDDAIVEAAALGVRRLNEQYTGKGGACFHLLHRPRRWNENQGAWMGWERKRGKLAQFNRFLREQDGSAFTTVVGDVAALRSIRYVITLDSDTVLPRDVAQLLAGTIAHPLNRAVYDPARGRVVHGYGILQPRVSVSLTSANHSRFAAIHSGHPGVDPYTTAVSDVYQDLYGEGSFTGKGIYDVDAFEQATEGRFPENRLLSHDLIEGTFARAGLVTDLEVFDDYPTRYLSFTRRKDRWIRGDWQLLAWLGHTVPGPDGPTRNRLSLLSRWKIFDNMRRSVIEISQLAVLLAAWFILPGHPLAWTAAVLFAVAFPWTLPLAFALLSPPAGKSLRAYYASIGRDAALSARQFVLHLIFLPHQALISADAILRTLARLYITHRRLLDWKTAAHVERSTSGRRAEVWRAMGVSAAAAFAIGILVLVRAADLALMPSGAALVVAAIPLVALWMAAPAVAIEIAEPALPGVVRLTGAGRATALRYALLHWRFFDRFVTEDTHWLAPDNFQETPQPVVATRTSPTNIGLHLLAIVGACDLGFLTLDQTLGALERVFRTLERMERFRGHFYNWYDLHDLHVLEPRYISTVDSGNLAGHLLALKHACLTLSDRPLHLTLSEAAARAAIRIGADGGPEAGHWLSWGSALVARHVEALRAYGIESAGDGPAPAARALAATSPLAAEHVARLETLARRAHEYALEMDFRFLFDERRRLFSIGYRESEGERDNGEYDLLASEARLTSFLAIAKDDVDVEHWFRLGRGLTVTGGEMALVSWSGSMFEYLMPVLVMQSYPFTLLDQTYRSAVRRQIAYGRERGVPWGFSESAYNVRDRDGTYQYRAFGVPDLALKRGLSKDVVVAPYASLLALPIEPRAALRNLEVLEAEGALGEYGFHDAIDYTRPDEGRDNALVRTYMAHHIGMSLAALDNALSRQIWPRRFHADPLVRSAALMLQERIPRRTIVQEVQPIEFEPPRVRSEAKRPAVRELETPNTTEPRVALLGTLPYTVLITNAGGGYSRYEDLAVTRWRNDATRDAWGQCCYVRDLTDGRAWSNAYQPVCCEPGTYRAVFASDRVMFERRDGEIETRTEIAVVPDDHAEVRRITVVNHGAVEREIELTSYGEIVLAPPDADRAHPVFSNLFVETEWLPVLRTILASRRPRSAEEAPVWCAHVVASGPEVHGPITFETDRARFIGRGRGPRNPLALEAGAALSGTAGAVLDPIFALRARVRVGPGGSARVAFTTLVSRDRDRVLDLADRYNDAYAAQRALDLSWTHTQVQLRDLGVTPADAALFQQIAGHLLFTNPAMRAAGSERLDRPLGRPALWSQGISGDWPILLAHITTPAGLPSVRQILLAHQYWRLKGITVDLVILNGRAASYQQDLSDQLLALVLGSSEGHVIDRPGGVFIRREDVIPPDELRQLRAVARVHVDCDGLGLGRMMEMQEPELTYPPPLESGRSTAARGPAGSTAPEVSGDGAAVTRPGPSDRAAPAAAAPPAASGPLAFENPWGGMDERGAYVVKTSDGDLPPMPWANVVANPRAGFCVTERGGGFTWVESATFFRLTPWSNDPVCDPVPETIYLRDEETGRFWCPTPGPAAARGAYTARHTAGASTFQHERNGIATTLELGIDPVEPVKISRLSVTNRTDRFRHISVTSYVEWVLGTLREHTQHQVRTWFDEATGAFMAGNSFEPDFASWVAFSRIDAPLAGYTADRREFIGRNRDLSDPAALHRTGLGGRTGSAIDPCAALQTVREMKPGETWHVDVLLGAAPDEAGAAELIRRFATQGAPAAARERLTADWERRLSTVTVRTPAPELDAMVNRWALYQALSCRMWARTAIYQCSGAYGFRDQLQDVMAFVYADPAIAREHIIRCAGRQFVEGDVQHWWHPHNGRGIRTRFSDDLVWLPFVADHYITTTGDTALFDERAPYISSPPLSPEEHERYELPETSATDGTIYEHCLRALDRACTSGAHDLPLIGAGDWNDGMNRVGIEGRGESVWLAWFLIATLRRFIPWCEARDDDAAASRLRTISSGYAAAAERHAWDGAWYRRAFFDDGTPLGSAENDECRIDSIAQSWSIISGAGDPARTEQAMRSFEKHLVREDARILLLLTPPFDRTAHDPGYIKGYLPGVRENGGQYTHAAIWAVLATAMRGEGERALELFRMIDPLCHARTGQEVRTYKVEPYVVAADVYSAKGHVGRGGWTWYTGSAAWLYRLALEAILGFTLRGDTLMLDPCIPRAWDGFDLEYRHGSSTWAIAVRNPGGVESGVRTITIDGEPAADHRITLRDDGARHEVVIEMGAIQATSPK